MARDLEQLIRGLSSGALRLYKTQLRALPEKERERTFSRLAGVPELSDIIGRPSPVSTREPVQQPQRTEKQETPLWMRGLQTATEPFRWIERNITQPFGAAVTAPFTPSVEGGRPGENWLQREIREYRQWEEPVLFTTPGGYEFKPTKGIVEFLPWLAVPSAAGVVGKLGMVAARGGALGRIAGVGAKALRPVAAVEQAPAKLIGKAVRGVRGKPAPPKIGVILDEGYKWTPEVHKWEDEFILVAGRVEAATAAKGTLSKHFAALSKEKHRIIKEAFAKSNAGDPDAWKTASRAMGFTEKEIKDWARLLRLEKQGLKFGAREDDLMGVMEDLRLAREAGAPPTKPPIPPKPITSEIFPEGFNDPQAGAIAKLISLIKESKPITKETLAARKPIQAQRIVEYERLIEKNRFGGMTTEQAEREARTALAGRFPEVDVTTKLETIRKGLTENEVQALFDVVGDGAYKSGFDRLNTFEALQDLLLNNRVQEHQIKLLEKTFSSNLVREILKKRPLGKRISEGLMDLANAPRALLASGDISGLLRQGAILFARSPIEGIRTVKPMLQAMFSEKNTALIDDIIRKRIGMDELLDETLDNVLDITALPTKITAKITEREEAFASAIISKLPFVKQSNQAYVTVLNDMRSRSALNVLNNWKKAKIKYTKQDVSDLNQLVNWASGRGTLPGELMRKHAGLLNAMFFSPKLIMSRIQFPMAMFPGVTQSRLVRQEAVRQMLSFVGAGAGILTMAKLSGASDIELNPQSAEFGKMRVKGTETRLDIWTGYLQYIRFLAQVATAERKTVSGRTMRLNRFDVIDRFRRSKMSPAVGFIEDLMRGETYMGEELPPKGAKGVGRQVWERMMPLAIQDLIDGVLQDGVLGGIAASPSFLGIGVVTYTSDLKRARDKVAKETHRMTWEEIGQQFGRAEQLRLEQTSPSIIEAEQEEERRFASGTPTTMQHFQSEGKNIEETYRKKIDQAVREFRATGDGVRFRDKVDEASDFRRSAYGSRATRKEYQDIIAYYQQPIEPDKMTEMNPGDVLRREFYQTLFAPDMYDDFGNYRFDEAGLREQEFVQKNGQQALDYIEEYSGARWLDKPSELRMLEDARESLRPYWDVADKIWSMYPPEMKQLSDQIKIMERTDPVRARRTLKQYPQIMRARNLIATYRKQMREINPSIQRAHSTFYG